MKRIIALLIGRMSARDRTLLTIVLAIVALTLAVRFGSSFGRFLYHLSH